MDIYDAFVFETLEQGKNNVIFLAKFEQYCIGKTNETYKNYRFVKRNQNKQETNVYVTSLRTRAKTCVPQLTIAISCNAQHGGNHFAAACSMQQTTKNAIPE